MTREQAVERLAHVLDLLAGQDPSADPGKVTERAIAIAAEDNSPVLTRDMDHIAEELITTLGAVFIDPALVDAVRSARGCFTNCAGGWGAGPTGDSDLLCDQCAGKLDIADAILAQLPPPPCR